MKSIATETIMKIFIMIAVILIASSFLLKAFNIDIFGFLKEKFGELGIGAAKALHIVIDEHASEIWAAHLTDGEDSSQYDILNLVKGKVHTTNDNSVNEGFYVLENMPDKKCLILATDEQSGKDAADEGYIYYVNPGTIIQDNKCINIKGCIGSVEFQGCRSVVKEAKLEDRKEIWTGKCVYLGYCIPGDCPREFDLSPASPEYTNYDCLKNSEYYFTPALLRVIYSGQRITPICDKEEVVGNIKFTSNENYNWAGACAASKDPKKLPHPACNLLVQKDRTFQFKYGLLCGSDGKWHPCTEKVKEFDGKICNFESGKGTWQ